MVTLERSPVYSNPEIMGGTLVFRGTRVKAQTLLDYVNHGDRLEEFFEDFPTVQRTDVMEFLRLIHEENTPR
jgi:uncharacterized protein (DUF433 family)